MQTNESKRQNEWQRARDTSGLVEITHIGGQALIEGIMMRGRYNWALAVRRPDGTIHTEQHDLVSGKTKNSWMYWPVIRGCTALVESLTLGYQSLQIAAENAFEESDDDSLLKGDALYGSHSQQQSGENFDRISSSLGSERYRLYQSGNPRRLFDSGDESVFIHSGKSIAGKVKDNDALSPWVTTLAMVLGIVLGMLIFIALPAFLTNLIVGDISKHTLVWNLVDGVFRIAIFITYIWLVSRMEDIRRMFGYHGAEHRTIHCYEHGLELTPENANSFPSLHVRCGTAFMLMTMIIAIVVFTIVPISTLIDATGVSHAGLRFILLVLCRILLIPLIGGLAYEVTVKWAGSRPNNALVRLVLWPGMQMQRLTTNAPDAGQLECAIVAMQLVLERERLEKNKSELEEAV